MSEVIIKGYAGKLEGCYHQNKDPLAPVALILHPDLKYGGSMNNKVINELYKLYIDNGFSVLKFNFRGVGKSEGKFTSSEEELLDATVALDWLHQKNMEAKSFWVTGFSFGAWIDLQLVMRRPEIEEYILISPPLKKKDFGFIVPSFSYGSIFYGEEDDQVTTEEVKNIAEKLSKNTDSVVERIEILEADHFFKTGLEELKEKLDEYIKKRLIDSLGKIKKIKRDRRRRRKKKIALDDEKIIYQNPIKPLDLD